jgi:hypothetical protein
MTAAALLRALGALRHFRSFPAFSDGEQTPSAPSVSLVTGRHRAPPDTSQKMPNDMRWLMAFLAVMLSAGLAAADPARPTVVPGGERLLELNPDLSRSLGELYVVSWSRGGRRLATGSSDNTAPIWNGQTGTEIAILKGHAKPLLLQRLDTAAVLGGEHASFDACDLEDLPTAHAK